MRLSPSIMPIAVCCCALTACAAASENPNSNTAIVNEIERLLVDLDSDEFSTRAGAFEGLQKLSVQGASRQLLAEFVEQAMVDTETSFEVRTQLERLRRDLPTAELAPTSKVGVDGVDRLLAQLADDSYARRLGAERRLIWLLGNADSVALIYERLKHRASKVRLPQNQTQTLARVYLEARAAWLEDETRREDPPAAAERIGLLVKQLADSDLEDRFPLTNEPAVLVELHDLLASDVNIAPIREALEAHLGDGGISSEATQRFNQLLQLTKPAMVAEYWSAGRHRSVQQLLVDVPSVTEGVGTSHFDRIDDRTAHCVAGVNLSEGDYPVGVALPHPQPRERAAFFHLVNLPTPRRRMAYEYRVKENETSRYAALVARTLERFLTQQLPFNERELTMIMQFDAREVSRFAGRYLVAVDDRRIVLQSMALVALPTPTPFPENADLDLEELLPSTPNPADGPSVHGVLCSYLISRGTQDAVPGLLTAIKKNLMLAPNEIRPDRYDRFAALAIARRDPWPDVDRWLEAMLPRQEDLIFGQAEGPELGATAASILLRRHDRRPDEFDLIATDDVLARPYGLEAYRYGTADAGQKVADWWRKRQEEKNRRGPLVKPRRRTASERR